MKKPNKLIEALFPWVRRKREREERRQQLIQRLLDGAALRRASEGMQRLGWSVEGASEAMKAFNQNVIQRVVTHEAVQAARKQARLRPASRRTYQRIR